MERKKSVAFASLMMLLLASFTLVAPTSAPKLMQQQSYRYDIMGDFVTVWSSLAGENAALWEIPMPSLLYSQVINFSEPREYESGKWVVDLTIPHENYTGIEYLFFDNVTGWWQHLIIFMEEDGYGWLFLNNTADVDCYTFNNNTGSYWNAPGDPYGFNGDLAALSGDLPDPGIDNIPGTSDDGFGDGTLDPPGSSIIYMPSEVYVEYWAPTGTGWESLFVADWPQVFTTETTYDIVIEPDGGNECPTLDPEASKIDGKNVTGVGAPWEFFAGIDHAKEGWNVTWGHQNSTAYVTYVCAWSMCEVCTTVGSLDVLFLIEERKVRADLLIADITGDEKVTIKDIGTCAVAFGAEDQSFGKDGIPFTDDDKNATDSNFDAAGDLKQPWLKINIKDIGRIAIDFGAKLTPERIIRP